jgi:hypothetical protein
MDGLGTTTSAPPRRRRCARRLNLNKLQHIGIAENEADVRMCNQTAVSIDYIGSSVFTDLDLRYHVPDKLETDHDRYPRRGITVYPLAFDDFLAFAVRFRDVRHPARRNCTSQRPARNENGARSARKFTDTVVQLCR